MRQWLFNPFVFYPLATILAVVVILLSMDPFGYRHEPEMQAGRLDQGVIVLEGAAFDAPESSPDQVIHVRREGFGRAVALRVAVMPNRPPPTSTETGARILLSPETAARLNDHPTEIRVTYASLPSNPSTALAVSLQGAGPADWVVQELPIGEGQAVFALPPQTAVSAIGLRAIGSDTEFNSGVEIQRIDVTPQ
jgi:hypothetical protein